MTLPAPRLLWLLAVSFALHEAEEWNLVAWEVPILGWRLALLRYAACAALPFAAGLLTRALAR